ncbi:MAG: RagB/SusD family nutrient uptake outer membrane protein [Chitinophagaceae bacterium]|nr:RagB/SusD family nutrient uptake outer membrane protein [Chitinophagaceae bacterium]
MKNIVKLLTVISIIIIAFTSCKKFLDQQPKSELAAETFFSNNASAELALNTAYGATRANNFLIFGINLFPTDYTKLNETGQNSDREGIGYYQHLPSNSTVLSIWSDNYNVIVRSNAVINGVEGNPKVPSAAIYSAEAKALRAMAYFNLVRMFGAVPKVLFSAGEYQTDFENYERAPVDSIWSLIISDLEFSVANAQTKAKSPFGKITKGFATALLAKVYLTLGSNQQRDALGDGKVYFQKCLDLCRQIKTSNEYSLVPYFPDNFTLEGERNSEVLWAVQFESGVNLGGTVGEHMGVLGNGNNLGSVFPGVIIATDYAWQNGNLFDYKDSIRRLWTLERVKYTASIPPFTTPTNPAFESFDDTTYVPKLAHYPGRNSGGLNANSTPAQIATFYRNRFIGTFPAAMITKYRRYPRLPANYLYSQYPLDLPVIRYSEVLLMLAEAANEVSGSPTQEAYDAVNLVRARARNRNNAPGGGLREDIYPRVVQTIAGNTPDWSGLSYTDFRTEILQERSRELFGEWGCRWFDLVRRGVLKQEVDKVFNNGWLCTYLGNNRPEFRFGRTQTMNVQSHHALLPIPQGEIIRNRKLAQNPGYPN